LDGVGLDRLRHVEIYSIALECAGYSHSDIQTVMLNTKMLLVPLTNNPNNRYTNGLLQGLSLEEYFAIFISCVRVQRRFGDVGTPEDDIMPRTNDRTRNQSGIYVWRASFGETLLYYARGLKFDLCANNLIIWVPLTDMDKQFLFWLR